MIRISALLDSLNAGSNLRSVLRGPPGAAQGPQLHFVESWDDLSTAITLEDVDVAVVDPWLGNSRTFAGRLESLRTHLGHRKAVLYLSRAGAESCNLHEIRKAGFSSILICGVDDDQGSLRRALGNAATHVFIDRILVRLGGHLESGSAVFLGKVLAAAVGAQRVDDLARSLQTTSPKLRVRTRALGIPGPGELLRWGRLIRAIGFQRIGVGSVARLAYHSGYADPGSLCRLFRELLGCSPGDLPGSDVVSEVAAGILRQAG